LLDISVFATVICSIVSEGNELPSPGYELVLVESFETILDERHVFTRHYDVISHGRP